MLKALLAAVALAGVLAGCGGEQAVTITAAGDYGASQATSSVLQSVADVAPEAHFALGDLSYGDVAPESAWCDLVTSQVGTIPFQIIAGNHDSLDVPDADIDRFADCLPNRLPGMSGDYGRQYWVDLPAGNPLLRVIAVSPALTFADGAWEYRVGDEHYDWTAAAIDSARAQGIPWVAVAAHIPCWSLGVHQCPAVDDLYRLLLDNDVDLVLHGHEHAYARTDQLTSDCPDQEASPCVADQQEPYTAGAGTLFVTVGTGGIDLRPPVSDDPDADLIAYEQHQAHGLLRLDVTEQSMEGQFVAVDGSVLDEFRIAD
jgi:hypothetical protein